MQCAMLLHPKVSGKSPKALLNLWSDRLVVRTTASQAVDPSSSLGRSAKRMLLSIMAVRWILIPVEVVRVH